MEDVVNDMVDILCIYCNKSGPSTIEHVFPKGLGGDDKDYLLENIVCAKCNNDFSRLELTLMRNSPVAIARLFSQKNNRGNSKSSQLTTSKSFIYDEKNNSLLEATMDNSADISTILPQIIFNEDKLNYHSADRKQLTTFIEKFETLASKPKLNLVEKWKHGKEIKFRIRSYIWLDNKYSHHSTRSVKTAPKNALWLQRFTSENSREAELFKTRIYLHQGRSITLKTMEIGGYEDFLTNMKKGILHGIISRIPSSENTSLDNPIISVGMTTSLSETDRAFAKIGLNLLIHTAGVEYTRHSTFDKIKQSILTGAPELPFCILPKDKMDEGFFIAPEGSHLLVLMPVKMTDETVSIFFLAKLYGGGLMGSWLSKDAPTEGFPEPMYFLASYNEHKIRQLSFTEYVKEFHSSRLNTLEQLFS